jgi:anti-sigma regulatory factor (Ser/Thr protein kinase)
MSETVSLKFEPASGSSQDQVLQLIASEIEELGEREAWPDSLVFKVNLVLEEVGINILSYGGESGGPWPEFEIVITSDEDSLTIEVSDEGRPFNPFHDAPKPSLDAEIEDRTIGGLGIHLVQTMMDNTSYQHSGGKNRLTMDTRKE